MRIKIHILIVLTAVLSAMLTGPAVYAESGSSREYQIKAAFLYNFLQFVDWPKEKIADANKPIIIGIIGDDPFGDAIEPLKDKPVAGRKIVIKRFKSFESLKKAGDNDAAGTKQNIKALGECHMLFICASENKNLREIIESIKNSGVLTVGESGGFLDVGGIVNFVMADEKVGFEVSIVAAKQAGLEIRSKLLRLAKKVVQLEGAASGIFGEEKWDSA